jgi:hypothetical protein
MKQIELHGNSQNYYIVEYNKMLLFFFLDQLHRDVRKWVLNFKKHIGGYILLCSKRPCSLERLRPKQLKYNFINMFTTIIY